MERIYILSCSVGFIEKWQPGKHLENGWTAVDGHQLLFVASHVSRTRHAHQVTAAALYTLLQNAYSSYVEEHNDLADNFDEWRHLKEDENPQFKFWSLTLEIQLSVLVFVRSLREGDFHLYIQVL